MEPKDNVVEDLCSGLLHAQNLQRAIDCVTATARILISFMVDPLCELSTCFTTQPLIPIVEV